MSSVRWRLLIGLFSLAATLALTVPAADGTLAEMWPNLPPIDDIWPNNILFVDLSSD